MAKLSVVIITLNEERNIARCIEAVRDIADEVLVVDSYSTDKTIAIAERLGARIVLQAFLGYVEQRNFSTGQAQHEMVLMLDADEVVSDELRKSIVWVKDNPRCNAYECKRLTNYCGKWIKHAGWYPDKKLRLYNRNSGKWAGHLVHESWKPNNENEPVELLKGDLLHYTFETIDQHVSQIHKFTELSARAAADAGKTCGLMKIWLGPKWFFINSYIFKTGFLDGYYGYLVCKLSAYAQLIKYSKTRQYAQLKQKGVPY